MKLALTALAACTVALAQPVHAVSPPTQGTVAYVDALLDATIEDMRLTLVATGGTRADYRRISRQMIARADAARGQVPQPCE